MSEPYRKALARRTELEAELARINDFIALYKKFSGDREPAPRRSRVHLSTKHIVGMIERMMKETNHPMTRGEIVTALEAGDVNLHSQDKNRYIGTILWRNRDKFVQLQGRGYWLVGEPVPEEILDEQENITN